ncbi:MAG: DEAD/DEAH box helicase [Elusimicrobiaceae bacterium]
MTNPKENPFPAGLLTGLNGTGAKAYYLTKILDRTDTAVYIGPSEEELSEIHSAIDGALRIFRPDIKYVSVFLSQSRLDRTSALYPLALEHKREKTIVIATPEAFCAGMPSKKEYLAKLITLSDKTEIERHALLSRLEKAGYERTEFVEEPGEYAVRGSIVDIFSPLAQTPVRAYFAGNTVENIRAFDIDTQNTRTLLDKFTALPLAFEKENATALDWLGKKAFAIIDRSVNSDTDFSILPQFPQSAVLLPPEQTGTENAANLDFTRNVNFRRNFKLLESETARLHKDGYEVIISCLNRGELDRFSEITANTTIPEQARFEISPLAEGFIFKDGKTAVITSSEILNRKYAASSLLAKYDRSRAKRIRFKDLKAGDFIVHEDYGIGRYVGLKTFSCDDAPQEEIECLAIEFKNRHKLYVPLYDFKKVQKYVGGEGKTPRLSLLGGKTWTEVKNRVKENVREIAQELLKSEALRAAAKTDALLGDEHIEDEFAASFPYQETEDQTRAVRAILSDMAQATPMDRVLVGDVGFGKTEVAIRAALRAALSGKQTAVLVPTTVLAAQHERTFKERLAGFPVSIAMLSRFQTQTEQKKIVADMKAGVYDIVVGTHRLISKDVAFKNLGLCVIDEEHRFGVKQKEKIRHLARGVHCLMLSATPIPRTMNQALANLRSISVIETPPKGRVPITTRVLPWDDDIATAAVRDELARGGQVFYVHNRVRTLPSRMEHLKKLMPEIKIGMGHGQMKDEDLEQTMWDFYHRKYDVLLASTIIESGLDVPDVNTLIVENAHEFGLAQLYQLRGRIGRSNKKASCFLFYPQWLDLKAEDIKPRDTEPEVWETKETTEGMSEEARQRLSALMEFGELGSGFRLAMRDLEIRGAGELLGTNQHGFVNEVGLSFYCELLADEISRQKGSRAHKEETATIDISVKALIPEDYLPDENERLRYYKRLLDADSKKSRDILAEIEDLCGPVPESVRNIAEIVQLRRKAGKAGIRSIEQTDRGFDISFRKNMVLPAELPGKIIGLFGSSVQFTSAPTGDGIRIFERTSKPLQFINDAVGFLSSITGK